VSVTERDLKAEAAEVQAALRKLTGGEWRVDTFPELPDGEIAFAMTDEGRPAEEEFSTVLNRDEDGWRALLALVRSAAEVAA
jgi:hypothetical protein